MSRIDWNVCCRVSPARARCASAWRHAGRLVERTEVSRHQSSLGCSSYSRDGGRRRWPQLLELLLRVPRVDADGDLDFIIELRLSPRSDLPDPRSRYLQWNSDDAMAAGLFTIGLPLNATRTIRLGPIAAAVRWDGTTLQLSEYLGSYKKNDQTYHPFFIRHRDGRFETAPEDGRSLSLEPGAALICGMQWFELTRPA